MGIWSTKPVEDLVREARAGGTRLKRSLGSLDLTALGVGAIIGTGIFVLTGVAAARYAGPAVLLSFVIAGLASAFAALVYAELASMVPVAGSAYTYSYAALGELIAWIIGWDLVLEYTVAAGAVAIGWSSYVVDLLKSLALTLPRWATAPPAEGGIINLPGVVIVAFLTSLLVAGTRESASFNRIIVLIKVAVVLLFLAVGIPRVQPVNWIPFIPFGWGGIMRGAAIVFFAYIGFDAVSTAAEEVRNPQRDLPIGILASLAIATLLYMAVSATLTGMVPYPRLATASPVATALIMVGQRAVAAVVSAGAITGLTSVILVNIFGQSRVFFAMSRDGLLPPFFSLVHPRFKSPYLITIMTGVAVAAIAAFLPIGMVAELANIGTLAAFVLVSLGVLVLRYRAPHLPRPFKVPFVPVTPFLAIAFSTYLAASLPRLTWIRFSIWLGLGLVIYFAYSRHHSKLRGATPTPGPERARGQVRRPRWEEEPSPEPRERLG